MKSPIQKGQWTVNEAAEQQAQAEYYRKLSEAAAAQPAKQSLPPPKAGRGRGRALA